MNLTKMNNKTITTLEIVEQINIFRKMDGKKKDLAHKTLLSIVRDEFEEEIREQELLPSQYDHKMPTGGIKKQPMFELTPSQAKQIK